MADEFILGRKIFFNTIERQQCILTICYLSVQNKEEDGSSRFLQFLQKPTMLHSRKW